MHQFPSRWIALLLAVVSLCACSTYRGMEIEEPRHYGMYLVDLSLSRSPPTEISEFSSMNVANDYFVKWKRDTYLVPEGMSTDFASIPNRIRTMLAIYEAVDFPFTDDDSLTDSIGRWTEPAVVHDAAYKDALELVFVNIKDGYASDKLTLKKFIDCYDKNKKTNSNDKTNQFVNFATKQEKQTYDELLGNNSKITSESARHLFLNKLHPDEKSNEEDLVSKFLSSATVYSLSIEYRNSLGDLKLDREACYCKRRSCFEDKTTSDEMFGHFLYVSKVKKWVIHIVMWTLDMFGNWDMARDDPITP